MPSVLISGANKGIGRGLVEQYLVRDNTTVVAAVRNPQSAEAKELSSLPTGTGSKLIVVKVDAGSDTDALEAVKSIKAEDVTSLDIVIANAGIFDTTAFVPTAEAVLHPRHTKSNSVRAAGLFFIHSGLRLTNVVYLKCHEIAKTH